MQNADNEMADEPPPEMVLANKVRKRPLSPQRVQFAKQYKDGCVVWVRLGTIWWPGRVRARDKVPPAARIAVRREPYCFVGFFRESSYQFVSKLTHIQPYQCPQKLEFIRMGMKLLRTKGERIQNMSNFPADVESAELATDGQPDILNSPEYQRAAAEAALLEARRPRRPASPLRPRSPPPRAPRYLLTRRVPDPIVSAEASREQVPAAEEHRMRVGLPRPAQRRTIAPLDSSAARAAQQLLLPAYKCQVNDCVFATNRLEVMVMHSKTTHVKVHQSITLPQSSTVCRARFNNYDAASTSSGPPVASQRARRPSPSSPTDVQMLLADWSDEGDDSDSADEGDDAGKVETERSIQPSGSAVAAAAPTHTEKEPNQTDATIATPPSSENPTADAAASAAVPPISAPTARSLSPQPSTSAAAKAATTDYASFVPQLVSSPSSSAITAAAGSAAPAMRYRNIPKKDRREAIIDKFPPIETSAAPASQGQSSTAATDAEPIDRLAPVATAAGSDTVAATENLRHSSDTNRNVDTANRGSPSPSRMPPKKRSMRRQSMAVQSRVINDWLDASESPSMIGAGKLCAESTSPVAEDIVQPIAATATPVAAAVDNERLALEVQAFLATETTSTAAVAVDDETIKVERNETPTVGAVKEEWQQPNGAVHPYDDFVLSPSPDYASFECYGLGGRQPPIVAAEPAVIDMEMEPQLPVAELVTPQSQGDAEAPNARRSARQSRQATATATEAAPETPAAVEHMEGGTATATKRGVRVSAAIPKAIASEVSAPASPASSDSPAYSPLPLRSARRSDRNRQGVAADAGVAVVDSAAFDETAAKEDEAVGGEGEGASTQTIDSSADVATKSTLVITEEGKDDANTDELCGTSETAERPEVVESATRRSQVVDDAEPPKADATPEMPKRPTRQSRRYTTVTPTIPATNCSSPAPVPSQIQNAADSEPDATAISVLRVREIPKARSIDRSNSPANQSRKHRSPTVGLASSPMPDVPANANVEGQQQHQGNRAKSPANLRRGRSGRLEITTTNTVSESSKSVPIEPAATEAAMIAVVAAEPIAKPTAKRNRGPLPRKSPVDLVELELAGMFEAQEKRKSESAVAVVDVVVEPSSSNAREPGANEKDEAGAEEPSNVLEASDVQEISSVQESLNVQEASDVQETSSVQETLTVQKPQIAEVKRKGRQSTRHKPSFKTDDVTFSENVDLVEPSSSQGRSNVEETSSFKETSIVQETSSIKETSIVQDSSVVEVKRKGRQSTRHVLSAKVGDDVALVDPSSVEDTSSVQDASFVQETSSVKETLNTKETLSVQDTMTAEERPSAEVKRKGRQSTRHKLSSKAEDVPLSEDVSAVQQLCVQEPSSHLQPTCIQEPPSVQKLTADHTLVKRRQSTRHSIQAPSLIQEPSVVEEPPSVHNLTAEFQHGKRRQSTRHSMSVTVADIPISVLKAGDPRPNISQRRKSIRILQLETAKTTKVNEPVVLPKAETSKKLRKPAIVLEATNTELPKPAEVHEDVDHHKSIEQSAQESIEDVPELDELQRQQLRRKCTVRLDKLSSDELVLLAVRNMQDEPQEAVVEVADAVNEQTEPVMGIDFAVYEEDALIVDVAAYETCIKLENSEVANSTAYLANSATAAAQPDEADIADIKMENEVSDDLANRDSSDDSSKDLPAHFKIVSVETVDIAEPVADITNSAVEIPAHIVVDHPEENVDSITSIEVDTAHTDNESNEVDTAHTDNESNAEVAKSAHVVADADHPVLESTDKGKHTPELAKTPEPANDTESCELSETRDKGSADNSVPKDIPIHELAKVMEPVEIADNEIEVSVQTNPEENNVTESAEIAEAENQVATQQVTGKHSYAQCKDPANSIGNVDVAESINTAVEDCNGATNGNKAIGAIATTSQNNGAETTTSVQTATHHSRDPNANNGSCPAQGEVSDSVRNNAHSDSVHEISFVNSEKYPVPTNSSTIFEATTPNRDLHCFDFTDEDDVKPRAIPRSRRQSIWNVQLDEVVESDAKTSNTKPSAVASPKKTPTASKISSEKSTSAKIPASSENTEPKSSSDPSATPSIPLRSNDSRNRRDKRIYRSRNLSKKPAGSSVVEELVTANLNTASTTTASDRIGLEEQDTEPGAQADRTAEPSHSKSSSSISKHRKEPHRGTSDADRYAKEDSSLQTVLAKARQKDESRLHKIKSRDLKVVRNDTSQPSSSDKSKPNASSNNTQSQPSTATTSSATSSAVKRSDRSADKSALKLPKSNIVANSKQSTQATSQSAATSSHYQRPGSAMSSADVVASRSTANSSPAISTTSTASSSSVSSASVSGSKPRTSTNVTSTPSPLIVSRGATSKIPPPTAAAAAAAARKRTFEEQLLSANVPFERPAKQVKLSKVGKARTNNKTPTPTRAKAVTTVGRSISTTSLATTAVDASSSAVESKSSIPSVPTIDDTSSKNGGASVNRRHPSSSKSKKPETAAITHLASIDAESIAVRVASPLNSEPKNALVLPVNTGGEETPSRIAADRKSSQANKTRREGSHKRLLSDTAASPAENPSGQTADIIRSKNSSTEPMSSTQAERNTVTDEADGTTDPSSTAILPSKRTPAASTRSSTDTRLPSTSGQTPRARRQSTGARTETTGGRPIRQQRSSTAGRGAKTPPPPASTNHTLLDDSVVDTSDPSPAKIARITPTEPVPPNIAVETVRVSFASVSGLVSVSTAANDAERTSNSVPNSCGSSQGAGSSTDSIAVRVAGSTELSSVASVDGCALEDGDGGSVVASEDAVAIVDDNVIIGSAVVASTGATAEGTLELMAVTGTHLGMSPAESFFLCQVLPNGQYLPIDAQALYLDEFNQLVPVQDIEMPPAIVQAVMQVGEDRVQQHQHVVQHLEQNQVPLLDPRLLPEQWRLQQQQLHLQQDQEQLQAPQEPDQLQVQQHLEPEKVEPSQLDEERPQPPAEDEHQLPNNLVAVPADVGPITTTTIVSIAIQEAAPGSGDHTFLFTTTEGLLSFFNHTALLELVTSGPPLTYVTPEGQRMVFTNSPHEILAAIGLSDENIASLLNGHVQEQLQFLHQLMQQPLAQLDVAAVDEDPLFSGSPGPPVVVTTARTRETNATHTPILSTLEQPRSASRLANVASVAAASGSCNLDASLAVIGVTQATVPTSLELPITITNPAIATPRCTSATLAGGSQMLMASTSTAAACTTTIGTMGLGGGLTAAAVAMSSGIPWRLMDTDGGGGGGGVMEPLVGTFGLPQRQQQSESGGVLHQPDSMEVQGEEEVVESLAEYAEQQVEEEVVPMTPDEDRSDGDIMVTTNTMDAASFGFPPLVSLQLADSNEQLHQYHSPPSSSDSDSSREIPLQPTAISIDDGQGGHMVTAYPIEQLQQALAEREGSVENVVVENTDGSASLVQLAPRRRNSTIVVLNTNAGLYFSVVDEEQEQEDDEDNDG